MIQNRKLSYSFNDNISPYEENYGFEKCRKGKRRKTDNFFELNKQLNLTVIQLPYKISKEINCIITIEYNFVLLILNFIKIIFTIRFFFIIYIISI